MPYMVQLQRKVAFPFVTLIMTMLAVPFAVTTGRRGALYGVGVGIVLAIVYWITMSVSGAPLIVDSTASDAITATGGGHITVISAAAVGVTATRLATIAATAERRNMGASRWLLLTRQVAQRRAVCRQTVLCFQQRLHKTFQRAANQRGDVHGAHHAVPYGRSVCGYRHSTP